MTEPRYFRIFPRRVESTSRSTPSGPTPATKWPRYEDPHLPHPKGERITDRFKFEPSLAHRALGEGLRLAPDRVELAAGRADLLGDAFLQRAPQLGATGKSSEATVEDQNGERVFVEDAPELFPVSRSRAFG